MTKQAQAVEPKAQFNSRYFAAASTIAATGDIRYYLNGVYVEPQKGGGINLVATDGHRMIIINDPHGYANRSIIIPHNKQLIAICKKRPKASRKYDVKENVEEVMIDGDMVYAMKGHYDESMPSRDHVNRYNFECSFPFSEIEGKFPDWRAVVNRSPSEVSKAEQGLIAVNPKYIADLTEVVRIIHGQGMKEHGGAIIQSGGLSSHMLVRSAIMGDKNILYVVMPMRLDAPSQMIPDFCKPIVEQAK